MQDIQKKGAREHLLVCPIEHIPNVHSLNYDDHIDLLRHMEEVGYKILNKIDPNAEKR